MLGFELFVEFAVEVRVLSERDAGHLREEAVAEFRQLGTCRVTPLETRTRHRSSCGFYGR